MAKAIIDRGEKIRNNESHAVEDTIIDGELKTTQWLSGTHTGVMK